MDNNLSALQHIYEHCQVISDYLQEADVKDEKDFFSNRILQDAVLIHLLAMGELTTHLSESFKSEYESNVDWRNLKQLRNIIAHRYGSIQYDMIWDIVRIDVLNIEKFCKKILEDEEES